MLRLGLMYYYGKGVAIDYRKSFDLFEKANMSTDTTLECRQMSIVQII
jgi:TPR repeat protein